MGSKNGMSRSICSCIAVGQDDQIGAILGNVGAVAHSAMVGDGFLDHAAHFAITCFFLTYTMALLFQGITERNVKNMVIFADDGFKKKDWPTTP